MDQIQAFDIQGLDYMMPEVVESGDGAKVSHDQNFVSYLPLFAIMSQLCSAIKCTHLLKSGVPAGCLARMGVSSKWLD